MARSFPPDVVVLEHDSLTHARFGRGKSGLRLIQARSFRLGADTFTPAAVTPHLANAGALTETIRRLRNETGKWNKVSLLLPDPWFRMNLVDLPALSDRENEALEAVRWSLKRTLPIPPEQMRVSYSVLSRSAEGVRVLVVSALDATLSAIEKIFSASGIDVVLIEPLGLNIWNAIAVREGETSEDRLFIYLRDTDFTTAVFRGAQPLFIRSRNLSADRPVEQEIRLSASYLRESLDLRKFASCHVAGEGGASIQATLAEEFQATVRPVMLRDFVSEAPDVQGMDAELTACTGVFTG